MPYECHAELVSASHCESWLSFSPRAFLVFLRGQILKQVIRLRSSKTSFIFLNKVWSGWRCVCSLRYADTFECRVNAVWMPYECRTNVMLNLFQHLTASLYLSFSASLSCLSPRTDPETSSGWRCVCSLRYVDTFECRTNVMLNLFQHLTASLDCFFSADRSWTKFRMTYSLCWY